jgi:hypothetical protein
LVLVSFSATGVEREVGKVEVEDESLAIDDVLRGCNIPPGLIGLIAYLYH